MFKINNCINLNIKNLLILLVILFILFSLYNKMYILNNYISNEKYKSTTKKYKLYIVALQNKIDDLLKNNDKINNNIWQYN
jgi:hypothetical protein